MKKTITYQGQRTTVRIRSLMVQATCPGCYGAGVSGKDKRRCGNCDGSGTCNYLMTYRHFLDCVKRDLLNEEVEL